MGANVSHFMFSQSPTSDLGGYSLFMRLDFASYAIRLRLWWHTVEKKVARSCFNDEPPRSVIWSARSAKFIRIVLNRGSRHGRGAVVRPASPEQHTYRRPEWLASCSIAAGQC
jgi:hypothetical protein